MTETPLMGPCRKNSRSTADQPGVWVLTALAGAAAVGWPGEVEHPTAASPTATRLARHTRLVADITLDATGEGAPLGTRLGG